MCSNTSPAVPGECIEWTGQPNNNGYGPHQRVYEKTYGPLPPGKEVCHRCHNRRCINPAHLTCGTRAENMAMSRGRPRHAKLSDREVRAIRNLLASRHYRQWEIADLFGISGSTVAKINTGLHYRDAGS